jgi:hypothetical protein
MLDTTCRDQDLDNIKPWIPHNVGASAVTENFDALLLPWNNDSLAPRWQVGGSAPYKPFKGNPVIKQLFDDPSLQANITSDLIPIDLTHPEDTS